MIITDGLKFFIKHALVKSKRDRYLSLFDNKKGQLKFYKSLDHEFSKALNPSKFVEKITDKEMQQAGSLYCSNGVTSNSETSIEYLYGKAPWEGGWLLINENGTLAIYRPEGMIDDEVHIKL